MQTQKHIEVMRKVALPVLALGVIDFLISLYQTFTQESPPGATIFMVRLNVVIAGFIAFYLWRGSLRMASVVRWMAVLALAMIVTSLASSPFLQPIDLTLQEIKVDGSSYLRSLSVAVAAMLGLGWLTWRLGHPAILEARAAEGRKRRDLRIPAALGIALVSLVSVLFMSMRSGPTADRAIELARGQVGEGYRFQVRSLHTVQGPQGTQNFSVVTAWNDKEIKNIPVRWQN